MGPCFNALFQKQVKMSPRRWCLFVALTTKGSFLLHLFLTHFDSFHPLSKILSFSKLTLSTQLSCDFILSRKLEVFCHVFMWYCHFFNIPTINILPQYCFSRLLSRVSIPIIKYMVYLTTGAETIRRVLTFRKEAELIRRGTEMVQMMNIFR